MGSAADPLHIPPNAACSVRDRVLAALECGDREALLAITSADFRYVDRTRKARLSGGIDGWPEALQTVHSTAGARVARELIGTAGDRIAIERVASTGGAAGSSLELPAVCLIESDAAGKIARLITWDVEDRAAAFLEAQERFEQGEAAATGRQAAFLAFDRAVARRDWSGVRAAVSESCTIIDHRALGLGVMNHERWIESLRLRAELSSDAQVTIVRILAWNRHGRVRVNSMIGHFPDGSPIDNSFINTMICDDSGITRMEFFEIWDSGRAVARFEEVCAAASA